MHLVMTASISLTRWVTLPSNWLRTGSVLILISFNASEKAAIAMKLGLSQKTRLLDFNDFMQNLNA